MILACENPFDLFGAQEMKKKYRVFPIMTVVWVREDEHGNRQNLDGISVGTNGIMLGQCPDQIACRPNEAAHITSRNAKFLGENWGTGIELTYEINPEDF